MTIRREILAHDKNYLQERMVCNRKILAYDKKFLAAVYDKYTTTYTHMIKDYLLQYTVSKQQRMVCSREI